MLNVSLSEMAFYAILAILTFCKVSAIVKILELTIGQIRENRQSIATPFS